MNKKAKTTNTILILFIVAVIFVGIFYVYPYMQTSTQIKTIAEHRIPADITKEEQDQGMQLKFYDVDGNEIVIPEWFKVVSAVSPITQEFTIVRHSAVACTTKSNCPEYELNPAIDCWNSVCSLKGVFSMDLGVSVVNPASSTTSFLNVRPIALSPSAFSEQMDTTPLDELIPSQTKTWMTTTPIVVEPYEGTTQTFSVTVAGIDKYTGEEVSTGDVIQLTFGADPTGAFSVNIVSPI